MGLYDREYMQTAKKPLEPVSRSVVRDPVARAPLWARIKFRLWLFLRGK